MKRFFALLLLLVLVFPVIAQSDDFDTYEFETGTTLDYPDDWDSELVDGILVLTDSDTSQVLAIDYPFVFTLSDDGEEPTLEEAVEILTNILLDTTIDTDEIYTFKSGGRDVAAYDFNFALSGSIYAVEFTNGAIGMLAIIEVDEDIENIMLESFDNSEEVVNDVALPSGRSSEARDVPSVFLLQNNQRFVVPAGWELNVRQRDDIQYAILTIPDDDVTVQLFDLSETVTSGTELEDVLEETGIDWEDDFGFEIDDDADDYNFSDREAISYDVEVDGSDGTLIILRFADDAIGMAVIFGDDIDDYETEINQLLGSFNNLGAVLNFIQ